MPDQTTVTIMLLVIVFGSIALHEFGHAKSADAAGDPTPRAYGRVTLNPFAHFDPIGSIMIIVLVFSGFGIGWGRPVPVNPAKMQHPRFDGFMSVAWGPLVNVILAFVFALLFRMTVGQVPVEAALFMYLAVTVNITLAIFNLIPLGPLDGHWLLSYLLPQPLGARFGIWSRTHGTLILFGLIIFDQIAFRGQRQDGILAMVIWEPASRITEFLLGL